MQSLPKAAAAGCQNVSRPLPKISYGRKKCKHMRLGQHSQNLSEETIHLYVYESRKAGNGIIIFSAIGLVSSAVDEYVISSLREASLACSRATLCVLSSSANSYAPTLAGRSYLLKDVLHLDLRNEKWDSHWARVQGKYGRQINSVTAKAGIITVRLV